MPYGATQVCKLYRYNHKLFRFDTSDMTFTLIIFLNDEVIQQLQLEQ